MFVVETLSGLKEGRVPWLGFHAPLATTKRNMNPWFFKGFKMESVKVLASTHLKEIPAKKEVSNQLN